MSQVVLADLIVLAKLAFQVAIGEKNSARTVGACQDRFFTEMGYGLAYNKGITCLANSLFPLSAIDFAVPWTESTLEQ